MDWWGAWASGEDDHSSPANNSASSGRRSEQHEPNKAADEKLRTPDKGVERREEGVRGPAPADFEFAIWDDELRYWREATPDERNFIDKAPVRRYG